MSSPLQNVAKVLVLNGSDEALLLTRSRTDGYAAGRLDYPGGGVDPGESLQQAAAREVLEEVGLVVLPESLQLLHAATVYDDKKSLSINRLFFTCRVTDPVIQLSHEHSEFKWVPVTEVAEVFPHWFYGAAVTYALEHKLLP